MKLIKICLLINSRPSTSGWSLLVIGSFFKKGSLEGYFNNLYNGYWSQGLNTPELIASKYNPSNAYNYGQS